MPSAILAMRPTNEATRDTTAPPKRDNARGGTGSDLIRPVKTMQHFAGTRHDMAVYARRVTGLVAKSLYETLD